MSRRPIKSQAQALPYGSPRVSLNQKPKPPQTVHKRHGKTPWIVGGLFVYGFSAYAFYAYISISKEPAIGVLAQDADVSTRYDTTAATFDSDVAYTEWFTGVSRQRRLLAQKAQGHVLEASAGTGRNHGFYKLDKCKSLTFVDQSGPMVGIAKAKFMKTHPNYSKASFITQSAMDPLPKDTTKDVLEQGGYDTVIQTMGLCSTPQPTQLLKHLGSLARPSEGKILLIEHGRSYYQWINDILDKTAPKHADRYGCWWNRDIGQYVRESGLRVDSIKRKHFGTLWIVEARPNMRGEKDDLKQRAKEVVKKDIRTWLLGR